MLDSEEEYFKLLEVYIQNVIASKTDLKGKIVYVFEAFCDISGYRREELIGQPHSIVRHSNTPSSLFEELWKTIKSTKTFKAEIKNKKKNGDYYWVDVIISTILDAFNNIVGYSAVRHPDMAKDFYKKLWKTIKSGKTFYGEVKNKKKNGDDYWVDVAITQDFDNEGNHIGYSAIRSNISKQKNLEDLLKNKECEVETVEEK